ncbi:hypothetical protein EJ02DRAFT_454511 [Clathrospora elynae]|uniref:Uncharacterized protein n=1 Tax=Clathrospora elynae TaxID=706981 RepID=A0A6A5SND7_9PLEO|nr:hypothetical protein EJ02DRAFT_454511 [Clathrospora elynae]
MVLEIGEVAFDFSFAGCDTMQDIFQRFRGRGDDMSRERLDGRSIATAVDPTKCLSTQLTQITLSK